jgi:hypothetical protein
MINQIGCGIDYSKNIIFKKKKKIVDDVIIRYQYVPAQGTDAWLKSREKTIGGSEMSIIVGTNPYQNIESLIKTKLNWNEFKGNLATSWGKLFEPIVQIYLEMLFRCPIYETGSLPGCIEGTSYSPDGFAVARSEDIKKLMGEYIPHHTIPSDATTILFEIKSPFSRIPNGKVPHHYISQPLSGLSHFDFLDIAYFVDVSFRICGIDELLTDGYNTQFHNRDSMKNTGFKHYASGLIGIYSTDDTITDTQIDYGCANTKIIENIIINTSMMSTTHAFYYEPNITTYNDILQTKNQFEILCEKNNYTILGFLPYKICKFCILPVERVNGYVESLKPEIDQVLKIIKDIKQSPTPIEKFNEYFSPDVTFDDYTTDMASMTQDFITIMGM